MAEDRKPPVKSGGTGEPAKASPAAEIDAFLKQARVLGAPGEGRGRLIFALDATMSRQPTWDTACRLQAEMFEEAGKVGGLEIQLVYYRGYGECRASRWVSDTRALRDLMTGIDVRGGQTQIGKVLSHARREARERKVAAMVFVGDALEEPIDPLAAKAGELGLLGVRMFVFQEGRDAKVEAAFRELARLTGGAYARFDTNAAGQLAQLLRAAAVYAAGGLRALEKRGGASDRLLLAQMRSR
ncbi:MAG TPA: VWA domain-containing protein [Bauldia sp.]|nr:VWA domain-containing protein [Bauldia sp.]